MPSYNNSFFCFAVKNMNPSCRPPQGYIVKSTWRKYQTLSNIIKLIINWKICSHFGSGTFVCFTIISHRLVVFTKSREDFLSYITWKICRVFILNTDISVIYKARFSVVGDHMLHTRWKLKGHVQSSLGPHGANINLISIRFLLRLLHLLIFIFYLFYFTFFFHVNRKEGTVVCFVCFFFVSM